MFTDSSRHSENLRHSAKTFIEVIVRNNLSRSILESEMSKHRGDVEGHTSKPGELEKLAETLRYIHEAPEERGKVWRDTCSALHYVQKSEPRMYAILQATVIEQNSDVQTAKLLGIERGTVKRLRTRGLETIRDMVRSRYSGGANELNALKAEAARLGPPTDEQGVFADLTDFQRSNFAPGRRLPDGYLKIRKRRAKEK